MLFLFREGCSLDIDLPGEGLVFRVDSKEGCAVKACFVCEDKVILGSPPTGYKFVNSTEQQVVSFSSQGFAHLCWTESYYLLFNNNISVDLTVDDSEPELAWRVSYE